MVGCDKIGLGKKQSYAEGKVVDWNGKPVAGVKIIATQKEQPVKGYEQAETVTGSDGTFRTCIQLGVMIRIVDGYNRH